MIRATLALKEEYPDSKEYKCDANANECCIYGDKDKCKKIKG